MERILSSSRIAFIDAMKGFAIILMIFNHVPLEGRQWWRLIEVFHMPLFFLLSGYLYKQKPLEDVLKRNFVKILIPYFFSCLIIWIVKWFCFDDSNWAISVLFGNGKGPEGHVFDYQVGPLWFLTAFFVAMIIVNLIMCLKKEIYRFLILLILFTATYIQVKLSDTLFPFGLTTGVGGAVFVYLGYYLKNHINFFANKYYLIPGLFIWAICVGFGKLAMSWHVYGLFLLQFVGGVYGTWICYKIVNSIKDESLISRVLCFVGRNSLAFLCIHSIDRVLNISTTIASFCLNGINDPVLLWQLDIIIKFAFVTVVFFAICKIPYINRFYQIKIN